LGQFRKCGKTHSKNIKNGLGWVGLNNWVNMVSKIEKSIKINEFRVKPDSNSKNSLTL